MIYKLNKFQFQNIKSTRDNNKEKSFDKTQSIHGKFLNNKKVVNKQIFKNKTIITIKITINNQIVINKQINKQIFQHFKRQILLSNFKNTFKQIRWVKTKNSIYKQIQIIINKFTNFVILYQRYINFIRLNQNSAKNRKISSENSWKIPIQVSGEHKKQRTQLYQNIFSLNQNTSNFHKTHFNIQFYYIN